MSKLFSRLRINWRLYIAENATAIAIGGFFIVAALSYFTFVSPDPHRHLAFVPVETLSTFDTSTDTGFSVKAIIRLPEGTQATVSTNSFAQAQWLAGDTCVEKRQRDSGRIFYRLTAPSNCLP